MLDEVPGLVKDPARTRCLGSEPAISALAGLQEDSGCQRQVWLHRETVVHATAVHWRLDREDDVAEEGTSRGCRWQAAWVREIPHCSVGKVTRMALVAPFGAREDQRSWQHHQSCRG